MSKEEKLKKFHVIYTCNDTRKEELILAPGFPGVRAKINSNFAHLHNPKIEVIKISKYKRKDWRLRHRKKTKTPKNPKSPQNT